MLHLSDAIRGGYIRVGILPKHDITFYREKLRSMRDNTLAELRFDIGSHAKRVINQLKNSLHSVLILCEGKEKEEA